MMKYRYSLLKVNEDTVSQLAAFFYEVKNKIPHVVLLTGEVGAGKTAFSRYYLQAGKSDISFASPTYTIVREYVLGTIKINHFDFYRLSEADYEWVYEYFEETSNFFLVEWPELHPDLFTDVVYFEIVFAYETLEERNIDIIINEQYSQIVEEFLDDKSIIFEKCNEPVND